MQLVAEICAQNNLECYRTKPVSGGDINAALLAETNIGSVFIKTNAAELYPAMFQKEAEGLKALQQVPEFKVPKVIAQGVVQGQQYLILEALQKTSASRQFWKDFGYALSRLHALSNTNFGWSSDNHIGSLVQQNEVGGNWPIFFATRRIQPLLQKMPGIPSTKNLTTERLITFFDQLFPVEPPSLLHGDLWSGNFMPVEGQNNVVPAIFDPAVYYGHREMDIGMSMLFGGFDPLFYDAYQYYFPLAPSWKDRLPFTQLYPLLVHAVLFGGSYINRCNEILKKIT